MRARQFRPIVDGLNSRILLSATSSVASAALPVTQVVLGLANQTVTGMMPGDEIDAISTWDWVVAGAPPSPAYDLSCPTPDLATITSTSPSN